MVKPALRRAWRDRQTVQFGAAPAHAMLFGPVSDTVAGFVELMDGTRSVEQLRSAATSMGLGEDAADRLTDRLTAAGVLDDATADRAAAAKVGDRLRADLASLSVVHRGPGDGLRRLAARQEANVQVRGAGRVGAMVARTLSAAGVGRVEVVDGGHVEPWEAAPGGIPAQRAGERRDVSARAAVSGERDRRPRSRSTTMLVVLAPRDGLYAYAPDPAASEDYVHCSTPHLFGGVLEGTGVVGPLVVPGTSPCANCLWQERSERDPSWPLVVGQWRTSSRRHAGVPACDLALATTVAGITASYALSYLDGDGACAAGYRLRLTLPYLLPDTERLSPHPSCPCGAAAQAAAPTASTNQCSPATMAT